MQPEQPACAHLGHLLELQDAVVRLVALLALPLHIRQQVHLCAAQRSSRWGKTRVHRCES